MKGLLLCWLGALAVASAQSVVISSQVIAGGGGTSTGGVVSVSATIGQVTTGTMSGGNVSLIAGFWGAVLAVQTEGAPTLAIKNLFDGTARISWAPNTVGFVLQEASAAGGSPASWANTSYTNGAVIPASQEMRFFRLVKP